MKHLSRLIAPLFLVLSFNAFAVDSDGDGLDDSVETNTGTFVSASDTGTNPNVVDSDNDGFSDGAEVSFGTDPNAITQSPFEQKLTANSADENLFGQRVAIDGETAIIGVEGEAAYIYASFNGVWSLQQKLITSDNASNVFGYSVAIDDDTAVVGAYGDEAAVYVFTRAGGAWSEQQKLIASDFQIGNSGYFGGSVDIDGDSIVVGAAYDNTAGNNTGAAYIFTRADGIWNEQQKLLANDARAQSFFGLSVGISDNTVAIGSINAYETTPGAAYIFTRANATWSQQQKLTASDESGRNYFGWSITIANDSVVVGATVSALGNGAAYVYTRFEGQWNEQQKLTSDSFSNSPGFGESVDIDGDKLSVGSPNDDTIGNESGATHLYARANGIWTLSAKLTSGHGGDGDQFGYSVGISGDTHLVGAWQSNGIGQNTGAAYVYNLSDIDEDGIYEPFDNCPSDANTNQNDLDDDGAGDACDSNKDGDDWPDALEVAAGADPTNPDDSSVVTNYFVTQISNTNMLSDPDTDSDSDGISDALEIVLGGDPNDAQDSGLINQLTSYVMNSIGKNVPAMGGIGLFVMFSSLIGLGFLKRKKK